MVFIFYELVLFMPDVQLSPILECDAEQIIIYIVVDALDPSFNWRNYQKNSVFFTQI